MIRYVHRLDCARLFVTILRYTLLRFTIQREIKRCYRTTYDGILHFDLSDYRIGLTYVYGHDPIATTGWLSSQNSKCAVPVFVLTHEHVRIQYT